MPSERESQLEATLPTTPADTGSQSPSPAPVALVEGSGPHLSTEMQQVLRSRLRIAALLLFSGFFSFLIYRSFAPVDTKIDNGLLFWAHIGVATLLGFCALTLCQKCKYTMGKLRFKELIIFGVPAAFFVLMQWQAMQACAADNHHIESPVPPWYLLMFTYAMFIPNTWRRATAMIAPMAIAPVAILLGLWATNNICQQIMNAESEVIWVTAILMTIGGTSCVVGVHTIGTLRREAFKAKKLGQYHLKRLLGAGGMGEVYLAEHQLLKRPCALKLIRPSKAGDPQVLKRFEREVRLTATLSHWNTIDIFDYGRADDGTFYYVMEYLPGLSLSELVKKHGPLEPSRVIYLLRQVCDALREAHDAGLIHRDIKPGNIIAAKRGGLFDVAKLLDFGLVKPIGEHASTQLTQDGAITGSPLYLAPEQAMGDSVTDARTDFYALGAVAYYMLTGRPPFEGDRPLKVIIAHAREEATPPSHHQSGIPADLEKIVLRCLEKKPEDRFASAVELGNALDACASAGQWGRPEAARWWAEHDDEVVEEESESAPAEESVAV